MLLVTQGGSGHAHGMTFVNARMNKVENPVIIDQYYCDSATPCLNKVLKTVLTLICQNEKHCESFSELHMNSIS